MISTKDFFVLSSTSTWTTLLCLIFYPLGVNVNLRECLEFFFDVSLLVSWIRSDNSFGFLPFERGIEFNEVYRSKAGFCLV